MPETTEMPEMTGTPGERSGGDGSGKMQDGQGMLRNDMSVADEEAEEEGEVPSGKALSEYGRDTWALLGLSAFVIVAGILAAVFYRRRRH